MSDEIHPKTKRTAIALLILLVIVGSIILYGNDKKTTKKDKTVPQIVGPSTPPPGTIENANEIKR